MPKGGWSDLQHQQKTYVTQQECCYVQRGTNLMDSLPKKILNIIVTQLHNVWWQHEELADCVDSQ